MPIRCKGWCLAGIVLATLVPSRLCGEEEPQRFLESLRQAGYYDVAAQYLQWANTSPLVSDDFKGSIPYEEAVTIVRQATSLPDATQAEQQLRTAVVKFDEFLKKNPDSKLQDNIKVQSGNINISLAGLKLKQMEQSGADSKPLREEARKLYDSAFAIIGEAETSILGQLKKFPQHIPPTDKAQLERRDELRRDWINTELLMCLITYQLSKTYEPGSPEFKEQLTKAAAEYEKMFEKHDTRMAGLHSRLQQGRCLQELGKHEEAVECFTDLTGFDEKEIKQRPIFLLYTESLRRSIESLIAMKKFDEAIQAASVKLSPEDARRPEWLAVQFFGAKALTAKAETLGEKKSEQDAALAKAAKMAEPVASNRGEFQLEARRMLEEMGRTVKTKEPENFAEAVNRGHLARQQWQISNDAYAKASPEKKKDLEKEVGEKRQNAIRYYRLALAMAGPQAPVNDLNLVYYMLCYLYLDGQDYPAAAVVGEHLARNFPEAQGAKPAAKIAMKAWLTEYGAAEGNRQFETERIRSISNYIVQRWPNTDDSIEALFLLLNFAIQDEDIDSALGYLEKIPEAAPRRGEAEVRVGVSLWRVYLNELRKPENTRPAPEKLAQTRDKVEKVLAAGIERMQKGQKIDATLVGAVLSLAQLYIDTNRPEEALKWLNDKNVGSLTLLKAGNEHTKTKVFQTEAYKVALRSYIGVLPKYKNDQARREATMKNAEATMDLLEKAVGQDHQAAERLTQIYIIMGKDLESQLLGVRQDPKAREALSEAFEQFLERIAQRPGNTYASLIWVAETFFNLGSAADTGARPIAPAAKNYFGKAADTYKQILLTETSKPGFVPNDRVKLGVQMRLATCYRRMGAFDDGLALLVGILTQQPNNLAAQMEAAQMLQDRGSVEKPDHYFTKAVIGDQPNPDTRENIIWGWSKLASRAATNPKLASTYYEATLRSYECRYQLGMKVGPPRLATLVGAAKTGIHSLYTKHPALGGPELKQQYDNLMRLIQRALKEPETGLKAFEQPTTAPAVAPAGNPSTSNTPTNK